MKNLYHTPLLLGTRTLARKMGILSVLKRVMRSRISAYEEAFHKALHSSIRDGDIVWDVGANVGHYTVQFLNWSGPHGRVFAFEPLPSAADQLVKACSASPNHSRCQILRCALADADRRIALQWGGSAEAVTTTAHISEGPDAVRGDAAISVECRRVDSLVSERTVIAPTVTKIDVEGFEEEVLVGGREIFSSDTSRELFIEVHFTRLAERGKGKAPQRIVHLLEKMGYAVRWVDPSHLHASREKST